VKCGMQLSKRSLKVNCRAWQRQWRTGDVARKDP